jgi:CTP-dependent riboflavin kinase
LFPQTITDEVNEMVSKIDKKMKAEFKAHVDDFEWLHNNGYISDWSWDFYKKHGTWVGGKPKYAKSYAYKAIEKEIKALTPKAKADLSDILEGATNGRISCGFGHGKSYWTDRTYGGLKDGLATEAFAEMIDSSMACPESLEAIKKYLPKSYAVFEEMIEALVE